MTRPRVRNRYRFPLRCEPDAPFFCLAATVVALPTCAAMPGGVGLLISQQESAP